MTRRLLWLSGLAAVYAACVWVVEPDLPRLWAGLPRLAGWLAGAFPPDFSGLGDLLRRAAETVAIATLGTTVAALLALPLAVMAARPVAPSPALYHPARALLDALRGVDGVEGDAGVRADQRDRAVARRQPEAEPVAHLARIGARRHHLLHPRGRHDAAGEAAGGLEELARTQAPVT